jgi:hypothetical protein
MSGSIQRGKGGDVSPAGREKLNLGLPKKTRIWVFHHSRDTREARNLARRRGRFSPPPPLAHRPWPDDRTRSGEPR